MMGAVFQCHSEQQKRGQFDEAMGALKTFASTKYVSHIDYLTPIFTDLTQPTLIKPFLSSTKTQVTLKDDSKIMTDSALREKTEEYKIKLKEYLQDEKAFRTIKCSLRNVVWGQCSYMLRTKLQGDDDFIKIETSGDVVELLKKIRGVCREMTTNASLYDSIDEAKKRYFLYYQQPEDDNEQHLRTFKSNSDIVEHYKGSLYDDKALIEYEKKEDVKNGELHTDLEIKALVKEKMMGTSLLKRSDMSRYSPLMTNIRDQYGYDIYVYTKTLSSVHAMVEDYARSRKLFPKKKNTPGGGEETYRRRVDIIEKDEDTGVIYTQDNLIAGTNNRMHASIK